MLGTKRNLLFLQLWWHLASVITKSNTFKPLILKKKIKIKNKSSRQFLYLYLVKIRVISSSIIARTPLDNLDKNGDGQDKAVITWTKSKILKIG